MSQIVRMSVRDVREASFSPFGHSVDDHFHRRNAFGQRNNSPGMAMNCKTPSSHLSLAMVDTFRDWNSEYADLRDEIEAATRQDDISALKLEMKHLVDEFAEMATRIGYS